MFRHQMYLLCFISVCTYVLFVFCGWIYLGAKITRPIVADNTSKQKKDTKTDQRSLLEKLFLPESGGKARRQQQTLQEDANKETGPPSLNEQLNMNNVMSCPQGLQLESNRGLLKYPQNASCTLIPAGLVLYNRIFKTGSETMGFHFEKMASMMHYVYMKQTTEDFYDQGISKPYPELIEKAAIKSRRQMFFNAHFYFRNNLKIHRTHTYINQVREPVARYISHYAYMHNTRHRPLRRVQKMIESGEMNETIEQCFDKQGQGCKYNVMTRFFCGPETFCKNDPKKALKRAKENIVKYYAVVGLLEHFHLTLKIIQKRLPCFLPLIPIDPTMRENQAVKTNASTVSNEMMAKIKQTNWADIELYEFVRKRFWRQVKACGIPEEEW